MNWVVFGVVIYVLLQLAIGLYASRRMNTETDYLLAGKRLGFPVVMMSVFATWFGAETVIGSSASVYSEGLSGSRADPFGYTCCLLLMGLVFAIPMYRRQLVTLGDLFRQRYGGGVEKIAALVIIPSSVIWAGAQVKAFGHVISSISNIDPGVSILAAAVIVVIYTGSGGLLADAVTDVIQGIVLIIGLFVIFFGVIGALGGIEATIQMIHPDRLNLFRNDESVFSQLETWAVPIFGSVLAQELVSRTLAAKSESTARNAALAGAGLYFIVGFIPVLIGLAGYSLVTGLSEDHVDQFLPEVAAHVLHPVLYVAFIGALISAILSTVDSALLAAAALMSHNVLVPVFRVAEKDKVRLARACVIGFGLVSYLFAIREGRVHDLVNDASAFGSAGILVVGVFALFTRFGGKLAAGAALLMGSAAWLAAYIVETKWEVGLTTPYLIAIAASLVTYLVVGSFNRAAPEPSSVENSDGRATPPQVKSASEVANVMRHD